MQKLIAVALAAVFMTGCGGSNSSPATMQTQSADGNWAATITSPASQPVIGFTFTMTQGSGTGSTMMNMNNMQMTTTSNCFGAGSVMTGQTAGGMMMGPGMQITMDLWSDVAHSGNHLNMVMTMNGSMNGMTGTYTLTGGTGGVSAIQEASP